ncbi:MAG: hypothetical protein KatS3mg077_1246 [Candidatus Binatia bacterium]|nr:MAG: hypothetical protein KatS3mg077_1246 [Candidatus Binatia bacterium]
MPTRVAGGLVFVGVSVGVRDNVRVGVGEYPSKGGGFGVIPTGVPGRGVLVRVGVGVAVGVGLHFPAAPAP